MHKIFCVLLAWYSLSLSCAFAQAADPFNTYLWNRQNAISKNGKVDNQDWFEWWYYKVVDPKTRQAFFVTYGVINPWDIKNSLGGTKAVIQFGDFTRKILVTGRYPVSEFSARYDSTWVNISGNTATDKHLIGHVVEDDHEVSWDLVLEKKWSFEAMGWAMGIPGLSGIYWYPAQASAAMSGSVTFDGQTVNLQGAPAYQDRNWGRTFPKWWTWLTSNHFKESPGSTLAAGGGKPMAFNSVYLFSGLCVGLNHQGKDYIFRTTDGDYMKFDIQWGVWNVYAENKKNQRIEISAYAPPDKFMLLPFQSPRGPIFHDYEALTGQMTVHLYERDSIFSQWKLVATLTTDEAGIEWGTPEPIGSMNPLSFSTLFHSLTTLQ